MSDPLLNALSLSIVAERALSEVHGPGCRYVIWLSVNQGGVRVEINTLLARLKESLTLIEGVTILGAEPFDQAEALAELGRQIERLGLTLTVYTLFWLRDLRSMAVDNQWVNRCLHHIDYLVCGPYVDALRVEAPLIRSSNQQAHQLRDQHSKGESSIFQKGFSLHDLELRLVEEGEERALEIIGGTRLSLPQVHLLEGEGFSLRFDQIDGQRWIDDLFLRERPTVDPRATWVLDEGFWAYALDRTRKRCIQWCIERSGDLQYPTIEGELLKDRSPLLRVIKHIRLHFTAPSAELLSGPKRWGASIKRSQNPKRIHLDSSVECVPRNLKLLSLHDSFAKPHVGDWLLLASLVEKLTRPKTLSWICEEMLGVNRKERRYVLDWLMQRSPFVGLLRPVDFAPILVQISPKDWRTWGNQTYYAFTLVMPSLPEVWTSSAYINRDIDQLYQDDTWRHLDSIRAINQWASEVRLFELGEACLHTMVLLLREITPERFYHVEVAQMETVRQQRRKRLEIVSLCQVWQQIFKNAQSHRHGDEGYMNAQLALRFQTRWSSFVRSLDRFVSFGERFFQS